jgi:hypothetical protein
VLLVFSIQRETGGKLETEKEKPQKQNPTTTQSLTGKRAKAK